MMKLELFFMNIIQSLRNGYFLALITPMKTHARTKYFAKIREKIRTFSSKYQTFIDLVDFNVRVNKFCAFYKINLIKEPTYLNLLVYLLSTSLTSLRPATTSYLII